MKTESADAATGDPLLTQYFTIFVADDERRRVGRPRQARPRLPRGRAQQAGRRPVRRPRRRRPDVPLPRRLRRPDADPRRRRLRQVRSASPASSPTASARWRCAARPSCSGPATATPSKLKRLAVRFATNVFPGNDVEVQLYDAGTTPTGRAYAFEATSAGAVVDQERLGRGRRLAEASRPMAVLRLFAAAREAAGTGRDVVPGRHRRRGARRGRRRATATPSPRVLADAARCGATASRPRATTPVGDADEVAVLPPVSGGAG